MGRYVETVVVEVQQLAAKSDAVIRDLQKRLQKLNTRVKIDFFVDLTKLRNQMSQIKAQLQDVSKDVSRKAQKFSPTDVVGHGFMSQAEAGRSLQAKDFTNILSQALTQAQQKALTTIQSMPQYANRMPLRSPVQENARARYALNPLATREDALAQRNIPFISKANLASYQQLDTTLIEIRDMLSSVKVGVKQLEVTPATKGQVLQYDKLLLTLAKLKAQAEVTAASLAKLGTPSSDTSKNRFLSLTRSLEKFQNKIRETAGELAALDKAGIGQAVANAKLPNREALIAQGKQKQAELETGYWGVRTQQRKMADEQQPYTPYRQTVRQDQYSHVDDISKTTRAYNELEASIRKTTISEGDFEASKPMTGSLANIEKLTTEVQRLKRVLGEVTTKTDFNRLNREVAKFDQEVLESAQRLVVLESELKRVARERLTTFSQQKSFVPSGFGNLARMSAPTKEQSGIMPQLVKDIKPINAQMTQLQEKVIETRQILSQGIARLTSIYAEKTKEIVSKTKTSIEELRNSLKKADKATNFDELRTNLNKIKTATEEDIAALKLLSREQTVQYAGIRGNKAFAKSDEGILALAGLRQSHAETREAMNSAKKGVQDLNREFVNSQAHIAKMSKRGKEFHGIIEQWWTQFGRVAIGFTIVYRLMNAIGTVAQKVSEIIKASIQETGELAALQAKVAIFYSLASQATTKMKFADVFIKAAPAVKALGEASIKSLSSIQELSIGLDELAQAKVFVKSDQMKNFAAMIDFTTLVAKTSGNTATQIRSELQGLMTGMIRPTNVLLRLFVQMKLITKEEIKSLKDMSDKTQVFAKMLSIIGPTWREAIKTIIMSDPTLAFAVWEKTVRRVLSVSQQLVSTYHGLPNLFAAPLKTFADQWTKTLDLLQGKAEGMSLTERHHAVPIVLSESPQKIQQLARFFETLQKVEILALEGFNKMIGALGKLSAIFHNFGTELKWAIGLISMLEGWRALTAIFGFLFKNSIALVKSLVGLPAAMRAATGFVGTMKLAWVGLGKTFVTVATIFKTAWAGGITGILASIKKLAAAIWALNLPTAAWVAVIAAGTVGIIAADRYINQEKGDTSSVEGLKRKYIYEKKWKEKVEADLELKSGSYGTQTGTKPGTTIITQKGKEPRTVSDRTGVFGTEMPWGTALTQGYGKPPSSKQLEAIGATQEQYEKANANIKKSYFEVYQDTVSSGVDTIWTQIKKGIDYISQGNYEPNKRIPGLDQGELDALAPSPPEDKSMKSALKNLEMPSTKAWTEAKAALKDFDVELIKYPQYLEDAKDEATMNLPIIADKMNRMREAIQKAPTLDSAEWEKFAGGQSVEDWQADMLTKIKDARLLIQDQARVLGKTAVEEITKQKPEIRGALNQVWDSLDKESILPQMGLEKTSLVIEERIKSYTEEATKLFEVGTDEWQARMKELLDKYGPIIFTIELKDEKANAALKKMKIDFKEATEQVQDSKPGPQGMFANLTKELVLFTTSSNITWDNFVTHLKDSKNSWFTGMGKGFEDVERAGENSFEHMRTFIVDVFSKMTDALMEFVKTGKFSFADFVSYVLEQLLRIQIQEQLIGPLAGAMKGLTGFQSSSTTWSPTPVETADLDVFTKKYAKGGIIDEKIVGYGTKTGKRYELGEKGKEAVIPLAAMADSSISSLTEAISSSQSLKTITKEIQSQSLTKDLKDFISTVKNQKDEKKKESSSKLDSLSTIHRASGGIIDEHVIGIGQRTGRKWEFGEQGSEFVSSHSQLSSIINNLKSSDLSTISNAINSSDKSTKDNFINSLSSLKNISTQDKTSSTLDKLSLVDLKQLLSSVDSSHLNNIVSRSSKNYDSSNLLSKETLSNILSSMSQGNTTTWKNVNNQAESEKQLLSKSLTDSYSQFTAKENNNTSQKISDNILSSIDNKSLQKAVDYASNLENKRFSDSASSLTNSISSTFNNLSSLKTNRLSDLTSSATNLSNLSNTDTSKTSNLDFSSILSNTQKDLSSTLSSSTAKAITSLLQKTSSSLQDTSSAKTSLSKLHEKTNLHDAFSDYQSNNLDSYKDTTSNSIKNLISSNSIASKLTYTDKTKETLNSLATKVVDKTKEDQKNLKDIRTQVKEKIVDSKNYISAKELSRIANKTTVQGKTFTSLKSLTDDKQLLKSLVDSSKQNTSKTTEDLTNATNNSSTNTVANITSLKSLTNDQQLLQSLVDSSKQHTSKTTDNLTNATSTNTSNIVDNITSLKSLTTDKEKSLLDSSRQYSSHIVKDLTTSATNLMESKDKSSLSSIAKELSKLYNTSSVQDKSTLSEKTSNLTNVFTNKASLIDQIKTFSDISTISKALKDSDQSNISNILSSLSATKDISNITSSTKNKSSLFDLSSKDASSKSSISSELSKLYDKTILSSSQDKSIFKGSTVQESLSNSFKDIYSSLSEKEKDVYKATQRIKGKVVDSDKKSIQESIKYASHSENKRFTDGASSLSNNINSTLSNVSNTISSASIGMKKGGIIEEHIIGRGLKTGRTYEFGEEGKEIVSPIKKTAKASLNTMQNYSASSQEFEKSLVSDKMMTLMKEISTTNEKTTVSDVIVNIHNAPPGTSVKQTTDSKGGKTIDVIIDEIMAQKLQRGKSQQVLSNVYGMNPRVGGR